MNEVEEVSKKRLKYYLKQFWVSPSKDSMYTTAAVSFVKSQNPVQSVQFRTDLQLKQYVQRVILAFDTNIYWECVNSYQLVERFIQGEPIYQDTLAPQLLIITYGYNEMQNRQMIPITNQIIAQRRANNLKTLLVSLKAESQFDPAPVPLVKTGSSKITEVI